MIPYIVALIFGIVIILYQVYASSEPFTAVSDSNDASGNPIVSNIDTSGNPIVPNIDASGNPIVSNIDASGNPIVLTDAIKVSMSDLFGLLGPFTLKSKTSEKEKEKESVPAPVEMESTAKSVNELEERIAKSVAKQVKDELISQRATDEIYDRYAPCNLTDAQAQGQEFTNAKPSPQPDMSEYIRKDSIPCWNCSIP